ncbi:Uncharacterized protein FKW44_004596, partial [Caligus rogercresseyi]
QSLFCLLTHSKGPGYSRIMRDSQEPSLARILRGGQGYSRILRTAPGYSRIMRSSQGFSRILREGDLGYSRILRDNVGSSDVQ